MFSKATQEADTLPDGRMSAAPLLTALAQDFEREARALSAELVPLIDALASTGLSGSALEALYARVSGGLHTLKGSAAIVGLTEVSDGASALSRLLGHRRDRGEA